MAVDASHITFFPPPDREMIYHDDRQMDKLLPMCDSGFMIDSVISPAFKADSGLTSISRKRSRDSSFANPSQQQFGSFELLYDDISSQMYQQQLEIDRFMAHHIEQTRAEMEEMRRRNMRNLMELAQEGIIKRLQTKENEMMQIGQLNHLLEEKVKSLSVDNQIWRELARSNEATANALRNNLQQVLAQVQIQQQQQQQNDLDFADDVQSCCGSNNQEENRRERKGKNEYGKISNKWCRNCGKEESSVLLLPCRHLCVCSDCVSSVSICPICKFTKSAGVQVKMR